MSRNVERLRELIRMWDADEIDKAKYGNFVPLEKWLAINGVLAVDAITDAQIWDLANSVVWEMADKPRDQEAARDALRSIATGEAE